VSTDTISDVGNVIDKWYPPIELSPVEIFLVFALQSALTCSKL
jgi:hypothetical protein